MPDGKYVVNVVGNALQGAPVPYVEARSARMTNDSHYQAGFWIGFGISIVVIVLLAAKSVVITKQQTVNVIQRLGKFRKIANAGLSFKVPFVDSVYAQKSLRISQLDVKVETKTKDNVFVKMAVAVQMQIVPSKVYDATYSLTNVAEQVNAYVLDIVRAKVPKMNLDGVFEDKDEVAKEIKDSLTEKMGTYGYTIVSALVTDIDPAEVVKKSMNEINAATREQAAASARGEADKIIVVKKAEAEAESKKLQGKGIADQRIAIAEGIEKSVDMLKKSGVKGEEVMNVLMLTQYFDTIKEIGDQDNTKVIFLPHSPAGMTDLSAQIRNAMMSANEAKQGDGK